MRKIKIGIISLGCARNLVDSELMLGRLKSKGCKVVDEITDCDIAIINTCGFVEDAKKESIDVILRAVDLKKEGQIKKVIVCGCLAQRYIGELEKEIPEADAILGIDSFENIEKAVERVLDDKHFYSVNPPDKTYAEDNKRSIITPSHYVYVKIAEGCRNRCSYCAIYNIRGDFRSRKINSIVSEVKNISKNKMPEINIIAQDSTSYGIDLYRGLRLPMLLKKICRLDKAHWIRLLYTHPAYFTDELIDTIAGEHSICKYIDLPIQHISDGILNAMNRKVGRRKIEKLIREIRRRIPDVALRTSVIVGFPGESKKDFNELLSFIGDTQFERLGAFIYSREDGTAAFNLKQQVPEKVKRERFDKVMIAQQELSKKVNERFMGNELEVLIEEKSEGEKGLYLGRSQYDAPEVDGQVYVSSKKQLKPGDFVKVIIDDTMEYDLVSVIASEAKQS